MRHNDSNQMSALEKEDCRITDKIKLNDFVEVYIAMLLFLSIFRYISEPTEQLLKYPLLLMGMVLWVYCVARFFISEVVVIGVIIYSALFLANDYINGISNLYSLIFTVVVYLPISLVFLNKKNLTCWVWYAFFIFLVVCLLITLHRSPDGYLLFYGTSRNYVSVYLMIAYFACLIAAENNNTRVPIILPVILFGASTVAVGRGGIISTFILLALIGVYRMCTTKTGEKDTLKIAITVVIVFVGAIIVALNIGYLLNTYFPRLAGSDTAGSNSERMQILQWYFSSIESASTGEKIFGLQPNELGGPFNRVEWNIHNSFLQTYANIGLFGIIIGFILIVKTISYMIKSRKYEMLFFLVAFAVRAGTDYLFPGHIGDIVVVYYCFIWQTKSTDKEH